MDGYLLWTITVILMMILLLLFSAWLDYRHQKFAEKQRKMNEGDEDG